MPTRPTVYHIPVCPFCQRLEVLLDLKGLRGEVDFRVVDITKPRDPALLALTGGTTALPVLVTPEGHVIKESLVLLGWLEDVFPEPPVRPRDPWRRAVEAMLIALEGPFVTAGYRWVMNQDRARADGLRDDFLRQLEQLDGFLVRHAPDGTFLFEAFGLAEAVFTPFFQRFWFLDYYEAFELPTDRLRRVRRWREACLAHPAAQQVSFEEIVKVYYDYAKGAGNGGLLPGRTRSSFVLEPSWRGRPWPPRDKYGISATDADLGLLATS